MAQHKYTEKENEELKILSENLVYYRIKSKQTQKQVAEALGNEKENYGTIERGQKNVSYLLLSKIANVINTTPDKLIKPRKKKQPKS